MPNSIISVLCLTSGLSLVLLGMMKCAKRNIVLALIFLQVSCNQPEQEVKVFLISYFFNDSEEGWTGDFADYPEGDSITYQLVIMHDTIPSGTSVNSTTKGLLVSGKNLSDDLFMFIKRKISGLRPNTTYEILFNVRVASNAPTGAVGVGGAPGESVYLKAGVTLIEPKKELETGMYRMNIDKGNQAEEGSDMMNIGHVGVGSTTTKYTVIIRNNNASSSFQVTTDATGEIWLVFGSDSGFEGTTTLYYTQIDVAFNAVN